MLNKVLLVDDDEMMHLIGKRMLERADFARDIDLLCNGKEALDYFKNLLEGNSLGQENPPELVILDINMPIMDGWEFLMEFSQNYSSYFPQTKISIFTSSSDPSDLEKSKKFPVVIDYIVKPLTNENLKHLSQKFQNELF